MRLTSRHIFRILIATLLLSVSLMAGAKFALNYYLTSPGPLQEEATVLIERGSNFNQISRLLADNQIVTYRELFSLIAKTAEIAHRIRAGEYKFAAFIPPRDVLALLVEGPNVSRRITLIEGTQTRDLLAMVEAEPALSGNMPDPLPEEGSLLPETYQFLRGETRAAVLERMQTAQKEAVAALWEARAPDLSLKTPREAIILASIVEKETGKAEERGIIAAAFLNRLKKNMRLQSDPTAIYGIEQQNGEKLGRMPTRADMQTLTPYNTYQNDGLPPTPICNPSLASIAAVLNPAETDAIYFVADGAGGHFFAPTLAEHNQNVAKYRKARREK